MKWYLQMCNTKWVIWGYENEVQGCEPYWGREWKTKLLEDTK